MGTPNFLGTALAVAQIAAASIDSVDGTPADNTFTVTIGGETISQVGNTDVATTAAALVVLLEASTHPYFAAVTWTNPSAGNIIGTADEAGVPFIAALSVTGIGSGSVTDFSDTTVSSGPNHWDDATNFDTGNVPTDGDTVTIRNSAVNILWGLDQNAITLAEYIQDQSYTGKIGLDYTVFIIDGDLTESTVEAPEYRQLSLKIGITKGSIGQNLTSRTQTGSSRTLIDLHTAASEMTIYNSAAKPTDLGRDCFRFLANNVNTVFYVRACPGGMGIGTDKPGETSVISKVSVSGTSAAVKVNIGAGVTMTSFYQNGGTNILDGDSDITLITQEGGVLTIEGDREVTTLDIKSGTCNANQENTDSAGKAIVTATIGNGGVLNSRKSNKIRTWGTVNLEEGATLVADKTFVTIDSLVEPDGPYTIGAV